jgi:hypothetical protein
MSNKTRISRLEEFTKYFDLCYWKERRIDPESPDLRNWRARKRKNFQNCWYGKKRC